MRRRLPLFLTLIAALVGTSAPASSGARTTAPRWASVDVATIRPGVQTVTAGAQCTANFVFFDDRHVYLGQAAHCAGTDDATATDGCTAGTLPLGTRVRIEGASRRGRLVYSSWITMQQRGETNGGLCGFNDFALVRINKRDRSRVNPTIPFWGGPSGLAKGSAVGDVVHGYGNSIVWMGIDQLRPKQGLVLGRSGGGRSHNVLTFTPGVPGDSGSAYLDENGKALGVLSTLEILPRAGTNNVTDLRKALRYLRRHTDLRVKLARGTEAFAPGLLFLGI